MPRYRNEAGVVVNIPEEKAARIAGLTPIETVPPTPRRKTNPQRKSRPVKAVHHASTDADD